MERANRRTLTQLLAGVGAAALLAAGAPAFAQAIYTFNIPAQSPSQALLSFGKITKTQVIFDGVAARQATTRAVVGSYSGDEALERLLQGTNLTYQKTSGGVYLVRASAGGPAAPQAAAPPAAAAEPAPREDPETVDAVVVTGIRASLRSAQAVKRNASQIVDSIVAEDIGKLPDVNVAEALQRITGVQITRNQGEGSGIAIRGLTQIRTELDGRSIFTASGGRNLSLEDVPSELLAAADVYKSPSAQQIEGGIGGLVNLRLRKPLDLPGFAAAGQVRANHYDLADSTKPALSGLVSNRWDVGGGEFGALLSASYQEGAFRRENVAAGQPRPRRDLYDYNRNGFVGSTAAGTAEAGDEIQVAPSGGLGLQYGERKRVGVNSALQWKPNDNLEFYLDGLYSRYRLRQNAILLFVTDTGTGFSPGVPVNFFPSSNIVRSASYLNATLDSNAFTGDRTSTTWQTAGGVKWTGEKLRFSGDLSYTKARSTSDFYQLAYGGVAPVFNQDIGGDYTSFSITGVDLADPNNWRLNRAAQYVDRSRGSETAARADVEYEVGGWIKAVRAGVRYADRGAFDGSVYIYNDLKAYKPADFPQSVAVQDLGDFFDSHGRHANIPRRFAGPPISLIRDFNTIRKFTGNPPGVPQPTPQSTFELGEKTLAGYLVADYGWDIGTVRFSGNAGVRVVRAKTSTDGTLQRPDGGFGPLNVQSEQTDTLPSFNMKIDLTDRLVGRLAAAKAITRPDFSQMSPSLSLDYLFHTGSAGNPDLQPIRSKQADASLEYYLTPTSFAYVAGFLKNVDGFISNVAQYENIPGQSQQFLVSRPRNGQSGKIRGLEVGWNQFLDFLPAPYDGLGFQANYTYVHSRGPSPLAGVELPLLGLSKNSYNLVGLYEKGPLSVRVAYNWRDKFITGLVQASTVAPTYAAKAGYLDASVNYDLNEHATVFIDAANLTHTLYQAYFLDPRLRQDIYYLDRRVTLGARFKF